MKQRVFPNRFLSGPLDPAYSHWCTMDSMKVEVPSIKINTGMSRGPEFLRINGERINGLCYFTYL